jgi:hypothetical protein
MALSCWARASLRYRVARTLLMDHLKSKRHRTQDSRPEKDLVWAPLSPARRAIEGIARPISPRFPDLPAAFLESPRGHPRNNWNLSMPMLTETKQPTN